MGTWQFTGHSIQQIPQVKHKKQFFQSPFRFLIEQTCDWIDSCPEATALVANLAVHGRYMLASVAYLRDQIQRKPRILQLGMQVFLN